LPLIPDHLIKIAESGISTREEVSLIRSWGADGILVGETLVKSADPRGAIAHLTGLK
jgi:indole-3-glycerol phosphate synthase